MFTVEGKVAVVTGGASGLGLNFAKVYARYGADVAILDIRQDRLEAAAEEIRASYGHKVLPVVCDVTSAAQCQNAVETILAQLGKIDILCNDAGISIPGGIHAIDPADWRKVMAVNIDGIFHMCHAVLPHMMEKKYGKIVNIASINATLMSKDHSVAPRQAYNTSKAAVLGMTRSLAAAYGKFNITVNAISPCMFKTEMSAPLYEIKELYEKALARSPMNRTGEAHEMDGTLIYLSCDESSYITGQNIVADGGYGLV